MSPFEIFALFTFVAVMLQLVLPVNPALED